MQPGSIHYEHSGKFSPLGVVAMIAAAAVAAPLMGVVYGYLVAFNPFIYFNFIGTLIAGAGVGMAVGLAAKPGHVRNLKLCTLFGLLAGVALEYTQWWATLRYYEFEPVLADPAGMWAMVQLLAELEPWAIRSTSPGTTGFLAIWGIEALILVGGSTLLAFGAANVPYCEQCNTWADTAQTIAPLDFIHDGEQVRARLEQGDWSPLTELEVVDGAREHFTRIELMSCEKCQQLRVANVKTVVIKTDKDGDTSEEETELLPHLLVDEATWDRLSKIL